MSTSGGNGGGGALVATAHLNTAAIRALHTAPTLVIPAPGAGKMILCQHGTAVLVPIQAAIGNPPVFTTFHYGPVPTAAVEALQITSPDILQDVVPQFGSVALHPPATAVTSDPLGPILTRSDVENVGIYYGAETAGAGGTDVGGIVTATLAAGGNGYAVGDTGTVDPDLYVGGGAYHVDTVAAITGAVLTFHITAPGDGYSILDNPLATTPGGAQPGAGTGLTVNVTAVTPYQADLYVEVIYSIVTLH